MKLATSMELISEWRKFEIKKDSFYHLSFGEPELRVAKINFIGNNGFELIYHKDSIRHIFHKMDIDINYDMSYEEFFIEFYKRKEELNCFR